MSGLEKALEKVHAQLNKEGDVLTDKEKIISGIFNLTKVLDGLGVSGIHYTHQYYILKFYELEPLVSVKESLKDILRESIGALVVDSIVNVRDASFNKKELTEVLNAVEGLIPYADRETKEDIKQELEGIAEDFGIEIKESKRTRLKN